MTTHFVPSSIPLHLGFDSDRVVIESNISAGHVLDSSAACHEQQSSMESPRVRFNIPDGTPQDDKQTSHAVMVRNPVIVSMGLGLGTPPPLPVQATTQMLENGTHHVHIKTSPSLSFFSRVPRRAAMQQLASSQRLQDATNATDAVHKEDHNERASALSSWHSCGGPLDFDMSMDADVHDVDTPPLSYYNSPGTNSNASEWTQDELLIPLGTPRLVGPLQDDDWFANRHGCVSVPLEASQYFGLPAPQDVSISLILTYFWQPQVTPQPLRPDEELGIIQRPFPTPHGLFVVPPGGDRINAPLGPEPLRFSRWEREYLQSQQDATESALSVMQALDSENEVDETPQPRGDEKAKKLNGAAAPFYPTKSTHVALASPSDGLADSNPSASLQEAQLSASQTPPASSDKKVVSAHSDTKGSTDVDGSRKRKSRGGKKARRGVGSGIQKQEEASTALRPLRTIQNSADAKTKHSSCKNEPAKSQSPVATNKPGLPVAASSARGRSRQGVHGSKTASAPAAAAPTGSPTSTVTRNTRDNARVVGGRQSKVKKQRRRKEEAAGKSRPTTSKHILWE